MDRGEINHMRKIILLITTLILFSSCDLFVSPEKEEELPEYIPEVVWKLETNVRYPSLPGKQYNRYFYTFESGEKGGKISKIDLETGTVVWTTEEGLYSIDTYPIKCGNYIFICSIYNDNKSIYNKIHCFSEATGEKLATIKLTDSENWEEIADIYPYAKQFDSYNDEYIYWINNATYETCEDGIYKLDITKIDFEKDSLEQQIVEPELVFEDIYYSFPAENENPEEMIYIKSNTSFGTKLKPAHIYALNMETREVEWETVTDKIQGMNLNPLYYVNDEKNGLKDRLYCLDQQIGCYDAKTGEVIWERFQTDEDLQKEHRLGGDHDAGVFYSDGRFYYTTEDTCNTSWYPEKLRNNILCIDAKTGKYLWSYATDGSLGSRPIVANGKVFVTTYHRGLYVFDAKSGKLLGVDKTKFTYGDERNGIHNGNVLFFDFHKNDGFGTLYCIKP